MSGEKGQVRVTLLTAQEAGQALHLSHWKVREIIGRGELRAMRLPAIRIHPADLEAFIAAKREQAAARAETILERRGLLVSVGAAPAKDVAAAEKWLKEHRTGTADERR